jgi:hypothetical protein
MPSFDDRAERIEVLLELMGAHNPLCDELTAEPADYNSIIEGFDFYIRTLKEARERLLKISKEVVIQ